MTGLDFALAQVRDRDLVIESLREQLAERWVEVEAQEAALKERAEAAEAKLNAHAIEISQHKGDLRRAEAKLAEAEKERDAWKARAEDTQNSKLRASMDRARELARVLRADMADCDFDGFDHPWDARNEWVERLDGLTRLLSGDE